MASKSTKAMPILPKYQALGPKSYAPFLRNYNLRSPPSLAPGQTRAYEVPHKTTFDQTKKNNDPKGEEDKTSKPQSSDQYESHPQKQPDPQTSPSRSTGIEPEGPGGSRAGKGSLD